MTWNEPGGNSKDPWGGRSGDQGPPDLDEALRKLQDKLGGIFGGRSGSGGDGGGIGPSGPVLGAIAGVAALIYLLSGIYIVDDGQRGVVLQFGDFKTVTMPGPHFHWRFIQSVETVNVDQVRTAQHQAIMLTQDENLVDVEIAVQYRVGDAADFIFQVREPDATVRQVSESAIREVIGKNDMDFVLTEGRALISDRSQELMQEALDAYEAGVIVNSVNLTQAQPPEEVQPAFADAIKAREDEQRFIQEAEAFRNEIIPRAEGDAVRLVEEAKGYRTRVVKSAEGETDRFLELYAEYSKAPTITRDRLYLETVESVLGQSSKVVVDLDSGNNVMLMPLDRLLSGVNARTDAASSSSSSEMSGNQADQGNPTLDERRFRSRDLRSREAP